MISTLAMIKASRMLANMTLELTTAEHAGTWRANTLLLAIAVDRRCLEHPACFSHQLLMAVLFVRRLGRSYIRVF